MSIDGPKYGTAGAEPVVQRSDRAVNGSAEWDADLAPHAVLIGLRPPDGQNDALPNSLEVSQVNRSKLGSSLGRLPQIRLTAKLYLAGP